MGLQVLKIFEDLCGIEELQIAVYQHRDLPLGIDAQHVGMFGLVTPSWIERNHDEFEIDGLLARRDLDLCAKHAERPGNNLHRSYPLCLRRRLRFARTPAQNALDVGTIAVKVMSEKLRIAVARVRRIPRKDSRASGLLRLHSDPDVGMSAQATMFLFRFCGRLTPCWRLSASVEA